MQDGVRGFYCELTKDSVLSIQNIFPYISDLLLNDLLVLADCV